MLRPAITCVTCKGTRSVVIQTKDGNNTVTTKVTCPACKGSGQVTGYRTK